MKVRVDAGKCQGHSRCAFVAPELFQLDEWGHSFVESEEVPTELEAAARAGAAACPEHAITVEEG